MLLPEILSRFQLRLLSTYLKCARLCFYDHYRPKVVEEIASRDSVAACVLAFHSWINGHRLTAPFAGVMASFYTQDPQVKHTCRCDSDLAKCFIYAYLTASAALPKLDLKVLVMPVTPCVGFDVEHVGLSGCSRLCAGNHAWLCGWCLDVECLPTGLCGPCCFTGRMVTGRWLWKYLDLSRKV